MNPRLRPYTINITWSDEDNDFVANFERLKGLFAYGDTPEEALRELFIASEGWLEAADTFGYKLP
jgi:predicted RNase H-like HicB family nuclease